MDLSNQEAQALYEQLAGKEYFVYTTVSLYDDLRVTNILFAKDDLQVLRARWARAPHLIAEELKIINNRAQWFELFAAIRTKADLGKLNANVVMA